MVQRMKRLTPAVAKSQGNILYPKLFKYGNSVKIKKMIEDGENPETLFNGICALILSGKIGADLGKQEISYETEVYIRGYEFDK